MGRQGERFREQLSTTSTFWSTTSTQSLISADDSMVDNPIILFIGLAARGIGAEISRPWNLMTTM